jgi:hypothetical protein
MAKIRVLKIEVIPLFDEEMPIFYEVLSGKSDYLVNNIAVLVLVDIIFNGTFGTVYVVTMLELIGNTFYWYLPAFKGQIITALDSDTLLDNLRHYIVQLFESDETFNQLNAKFMVNSRKKRNYISFDDISNLALFNAFDPRHIKAIDNRLPPRKGLSIIFDPNVKLRDIDTYQPVSVLVNSP